MKINKENVGYIFAIVLLIMALVLLIYLGFSGWYFYGECNYSTDLQLGKTMQVNVKENQANALSLNVEGSYLPGEALPQVVVVKNSDEKELLVRAKAYISGGNEVSAPIEIVNSQNWTYCEDGYYYYNSILSSQAKSTLCDFINMPNDLLLQSTKKYIVTVVFEAINCNQDVTSLWGNAAVINSLK